MSTINGIKLVRDHGKVNVEASLAAWNEREAERVERDRNKVLNALHEHMEHAGRWDGEFAYYLQNFWSTVAADARIAKTALVSLVTAEMYKAGKIPVSELSEVSDLFLAYVDANIGEPDSDAWMCQGKGRNGQVTLNKKTT